MVERSQTACFIKLLALGVSFYIFLAKVTSHSSPRGADTAFKDIPYFCRYCIEPELPVTESSVMATLPFYVLLIPVCLRNLVKSMIHQAREPYDWDERNRDR